MTGNRLEIITQYVKSCLDGNTNAHGLDHALRVCQNIEKLLPHYPNADHELCLVAGLVHDVIDDKVTPDVTLAKQN